MASPPNPDQAPKPIAKRVASLSDVCADELRGLREADRLRTLGVAESSGRTIAIDGRDVVNLASNDYLALSTHPKLIEAAVQATRHHGVGSGASRLVSGTQPMHEQVETRFAEFKHAEAALLLPTGYTANLAVLTTLAGPDDLILADKLVHASLIDAARASDATLRTYPHLDLDRAEAMLKRHRSRSVSRCLLVTDSVFSMDGDCADLPALCDLADRYDASLVIDEAHGTGVLGADGSGLASAQGVEHRIYHCGTGGVAISTASKALGGLGGIIAADRAVIDLIINKARPFIYSTAVPPAQAAAIDAAIDVIRDEPDRRKRLVEWSASLRDELRASGWPIDEAQHVTPIIPLITGEVSAALKLQAQLLACDIFAPAIRPPTVPPGGSRVRLSLRSDLTRDDVRQVIDAVGVPRA